MREHEFTIIDGDRRVIADGTVRLDTRHRVADLYNIVNVPTAVWIDEDLRWATMRAEGPP